MIYKQLKDPEKKTYFGTAKGQPLILENLKTGSRLLKNIGRNEILDFLRGISRNNLVLGLIGREKTLRPAAGTLTTL